MGAQSQLLTLPPVQSPPWPDDQFYDHLSKPMARLESRMNEDHV